MYTVIKETADFLLEAGVVDQIPSRVAFMQAVNAAFIVMATEP